MNTSDNLEKLADYIERHVEQKNLDMRDFRRGPGNYFATYHSKDCCGTSGCALGWAPFVSGLEPHKHDFLKEDGLYWEKYSERIFPDIETYSKDWLSIFDSGLSSNKSSVIKRLRDKANEIRSNGDT